MTEASLITADQINLKYKWRNLVLGLLFDLMGKLSFAIPGIGEFSDIIWAPVAKYLMQWMYKGRVAKTMSWVVAIEELLPFTDVVPSFTIMWFYTYVVNPPSSKV